MEKLAPLPTFSLVLIRPRVGVTMYTVQYEMDMLTQHDVTSADSFNSLVLALSPYQSGPN